MAMIAGTSLAGRAGQYLVASSVNAIAEQIRREIGNNLTMNNVARVVKSILPGKRNASKRRAVVQKLKNGPTTSRQILRAPVAINTPNTFRVRAGTNNFRVKNREFVAEITTNADGSYDLQRVISIQPGLSPSFPWLSQIATNHQKYRFHKLTYSYVPSCGTQTNGRVAMAYAVDPLDEFPIDQQTLYQYPEQTDSALWSPMSYSIPPHQLKPLFTRSRIQDGTDLKTYDNGVLFVATYGGGEAATTGSLFVEYEVELINPQPKVIADPMNYQLGTPVSPNQWYSSAVTELPGAPFQIICDSERSGFRFTQTGWWCVRFNIFTADPETTSPILPTSGTQAGAAVIPPTGTDVVIQDGVRMHLEVWVNVLRTIPVGTRHFYFEFGNSGIANITSMALSVNSMKNGQITSI